MNFYDSERIEDVLKPLGYRVVEEYRNADMVILNTCHIREKAAEKVYSELGRIKKAKDHKKEMIIAVAGCVGQAEGEEIFKRAPYVNIVVGPQSYQNLPDLISKSMRKGKALDLDFPVEPKFDLLPEKSDSKVSAFLSVQEGCDKFCTFCVVPYTRGAEYSRSVPEIYREAIKLVSFGAKDINLLGQNVNAFHGTAEDGQIWSLGKVIRHLEKINGLERIRYTTSHPRDMDDDLIAAHGEVEKLMPFLHLPVQSGSDSVLKQMNRKHSAKDYLHIIEKLRKARDGMEFSSDFIVGFPGETDKDFEDTMNLVREVGYASSFSFKYSPRPGTPAAEREDQVPEEVKSERLTRLQELLFSQQSQFNQKFIGKKIKVLFDEKARIEGRLFGKTEYLQSVHVAKGGNLAGEIAEITITKASQNSLEGVVLLPLA